MGGPGLRPSCSSPAASRLSTPAAAAASPCSSSALSGRWPRRAAAAAPQRRPLTLAAVGAAASPLAGRPQLRALRPVKMVPHATNSAMPLASIDAFGEASMQITIDNKSDPGCTTIRVTGPGQSDCLLLLVNGLFSEGYQVLSSSYSNTDGMVEFTVRVVGDGGAQLTDVQALEVREVIERLVSTTKMSTRPAIYGMVAERELARLESGSAGGAGGSGGAAVSDALDLERTATEVAVAAARFAAAERALQAAAAAGEAGGRVAAAEQARSEAASTLERAIAAVEAMITSRRVVIAAPPAEEPKSAADLLREQLTGATPAAPPQQVGVGPGVGNGYEMLLQGFNWESHKGGKYYKYVADKAAEWAEMGFTAVWMPPPSDSVSPQGYLPRDLYDLNSAYGSEADLRAAIAALHDAGIKAVADIVVNHRCAHFQGSDGKWNKFGGRLAWDAGAICNNNPAWGGHGGHKTGDDYPAAPNIDHTQERIRNDIIGWLKYLRTVGFDGWRFDFVRGYGGQFVKAYIDATVPDLAFGEYWDSCEYSDGVLNYNQDGHRQRTINWCDATGGTAAAFDFTTKGMLQEALGRNELWRLVDAQGRPPGMVGMWASRAVTFIDNHDTGSTLNHWPFPSQHLQEGYAYILTHPGTPCVFLDHVTGDGGLRKIVLDLIKLRASTGVNARSKAVVRKAAADVYAATIDDKVAVKIGRGDWSPNAAGVNLGGGGKEWKLAVTGQNVAVWTVAP